jgi:hypothetical protein
MAMLNNQMVIHIYSCHLVLMYVFSCSNTIHLAVHGKYSNWAMNCIPLLICSYRDLELLANLLGTTSMITHG